MDKYLNIIRMGFIAFPFLAMLFTFPFIIHNYHKYGSISKLRTICLNNKKIDVLFTLLFRNIMLFIMPIFLLYGVFNGKSVLYAILFMIYFIYGFITFFKILVARKLFYEKLFKTDFENTLLK